MVCVDAGEEASVFPLLTLGCSYGVFIYCLRADVSYFLCCTRKRDVFVTPSLIVFQRPAGRVFYFA